MISLRRSCVLVVLAVLVTSSLADFGHKKHQGGHNRKSKEQCGSDGQVYSSLCCMIETHGCAKKGEHELGDGHVAPKRKGFCSNSRNVTEARQSKRVVRSDDNWTGRQLCASVEGKAQTFENRCLFHKVKCDSMNAGCNKSSLLPADGCSKTTPMCRMACPGGRYKKDSNGCALCECEKRGKGRAGRTQTNTRLVHMGACGDCNRTVLCPKLTKQILLVAQVETKMGKDSEKMGTGDKKGKRANRKNARMTKKQKRQEKRTKNMKKRISHLTCPCDVTMAKCEASLDGKQIPKRKDICTKSEKSS